MKDFTFVFTINDEDEYEITHLDDEGEIESVYSGPDFGNLLRHAVVDVDKVLAASAWTKDYFEWDLNHSLNDEDLEDENE